MSLLFPLFSSTLPRLGKCEIVPCGSYVDSSICSKKPKRPSNAARLLGAVRHFHRSSAHVAFTSFQQRVVFPQVFFFLSCFIKVGNTFPLCYVPVHQHQVLWTSLSRTWPSTSVFLRYYDKINWFHLLPIQLLCCVLQLCVFCIVFFTM